MLPSFLLFAALASAPAQTPAPSTQTAVTPQHAPNFEAERKQANDLFLAQKPLEALPLYEDLCRQDPTIAVFAERHGAGLLAKQATLTDPAERLKTHTEAIAELKRSQSLGDNSPYVRAILNIETKNLMGSVLTDIPLSVGYTYHGNAAAQAAFRQAEAAFGRSAGPPPLPSTSKPQPRTPPGTTPRSTPATPTTA